MALATGARLAYQQVNNGRSTDAETEFNELTDFTLEWHKVSTDSAATTVTTNVFVAVRPFKYKVVGVKWLQPTATTANATTYVTIGLNVNDAAASTMLSVAAKSTTATGFAAYTAYSLTLTSNTAIASTYALYVNLSKASAGKKIPAGSGMVVHCRKV